MSEDRVEASPTFTILFSMIVAYFSGVIVLIVGGVTLGPAWYDHNVPLWLQHSIDTVYWPILFLERHWPF